MKIQLLLLGVLIVMACAWEAHASRVLRSVGSVPELRGKRVSLGIGSFTDYRLGLRGFQAEIGFKLKNMVRLDLRAGTARGPYRSIAARKNSGEETADADPPSSVPHESPGYDPYRTGDPGKFITPNTYSSNDHGFAEMRKPRDYSDVWRFTFGEVGISTHSRLFVERAPLLSERARFGVGYGKFLDSRNGQTFKGWTYGFEAALQYQLGAGSPAAIDLALNYRNGHIVESQNSDNAGLLPVQWLGPQVSFVFWF